MQATLLLPLLLSAVAAQQTFSTGNFEGVLNEQSGVLQSLRPASDDSFDFSPSDFFSMRNEVGNYHTGDITLRWRAQGQTAWNEVDTAAQRHGNPGIAQSDGSIAETNFDSNFPDAAKLFNITRNWKVEDGDLVLQATLTASSPVEIGAFGFPIEFNSIFTNRSADEVTAKCVLVDPYIGLDAGYLQVTRLTGTGPNLIITPYGNASKFEAYRFLQENPDQPIPYQTQTFEGLYAWQTLSKAYAENEWNATEPWNVPTSMTLNPGQTTTFGLRFGLAQDVPSIEPAVSSKGLPVAVGVPGYILPTDMDGSLYIDSPSPVQTMDIEPSGALTLTPSQAKNSSWIAYRVQAAQGGYGRARVTLTYQDGRVQTVHYYITDTTSNTASKLSDFLFTKQWYTDSSDPFHRAPSVISYDHDAQQQVLQESRAWIAGISDEGGAGAFEAAAMKTSIHPDPDQVAQLEAMVNGSIWGGLQLREPDPEVANTFRYGVQRSAFYYDPEKLPGFQYDPSSNFGGTWNKNDAHSVWRAYDYVHVSALYWSLYAAEKASPGILKEQNATWYLTQAYETVVASQEISANGTALTSYADVGLMCETVWLDILRALQNEGLSEQASALESAMRKRQQLWSTQSDPFGSEMAWDSTGQEGVYLWSKYFNDAATVSKTLASIRGYMPTVAHWGWNGNARRYWDFLYGGKLERIERMIHHYGSGLNALPLLDAFKYNKDPSSSAALYDLRVGYGGTMGPLTNIHEDGFGAMAFHSFPDTMRWDAYSGDYGPNYLGHVLGACTYLVHHSDFGWVSFGGNLQMDNGGSVSVQPKDMVKRKIRVAAMGLSMQVDAGMISEFTYDPATKSVAVKLGQAQGEGATTALMSYEDTLGSGVKLQSGRTKQVSGGTIVSLPSTVTFAV